MKLHQNYLKKHRRESYNPMEQRAYDKEEVYLTMPSCREKKHKEILQEEEVTKDQSLYWECEFQKFPDKPLRMLILQVGYHLLLPWSGIILGWELKSLWQKESQVRWESQMDDTNVGAINTHKNMIQRVD